MRKFIKRHKPLGRLALLALLCQLNPLTIRADTVGPSLQLLSPWYLPDGQEEGTWTLRTDEGNRVTGFVSDPDGINRVTVIIRRYRDGAYWTGNNWQYGGIGQLAVLSSFPSASDPNRLAFVLPYGPPDAALIAGEKYLILIEAVDRAANRTSLTYTFTAVPGPSGT